MDLDKNQPLVQYLNEYRPDMPPCEDTVAKDMVNSILLMEVKSGVYRGMTYIQALTKAKVEHAIEHPESISLGDISKITADRKSKVQVEATESLLDLFTALKQEPSDVVVIDSEGHGHRG